MPSPNPPTPATKNRPSFYCTDEVYERVYDAAHAERKSISEWLRDLALREVANRESVTA